MRATRVDVAEKAGVSVATVSYVLNNTYQVKEETRDRVLAAARALNYIPDLRARSMATNRTMQLAVIVSSLTDPEYCEIVECFIHRAAQKGYFVTVSTRIGGILQNIRNVISQHVDGVFILSAPDELEAEVIYHLTETEIRAVSGVPLIHENSRQQICSIEIDWEGAFRSAIAYFMEKGHRHIAWVGIQGNVEEERLLERYKETAKCTAGLEMPFFSSFGYDNGYKAGFTLCQPVLDSCDRRVTAVLCADDAIASGFIDALSDYSLSVPADISVMGMKTLGALHGGQNITAMAVDYREFAEKAFDMLQDFIDGNMISHHKMPCILREGTTVTHRSL